MAGISVFQSLSVNWKRQSLLIHVLLLCVFINLMECMHALNSVQPLNGLRIDLVHVNSLLPPSITSTERLKRAVQRSHERLQKLHMMSAGTDKLRGDGQMNDIAAPVSAGTGEFLIQMAIGSPALSVSAILDTGSDLIWMQCKPCSNCYQQPTPIYDPSLSSTYTTVPCTSSICQPPTFSCNNNEDCAYHIAYSDGSFTQGILSYETFTLSSQLLLNIGFGCGHNNSGTGMQGGGLVGFGRGPFSLISQVGPLVGNMFSYCLVSVTDSPSKSSPLFLGNTTLFNSQAVSWTPLIPNSRNPNFYYISLLSISINGELLEIPAGTFDLQSDGSGGIIIDSGTTFTFLPQVAYAAVKDILRTSIDLPEANGSSAGLDLCFNLQGSSSSTFPDMTFHFEGANYIVPTENYLWKVNSNIICLAMLPTSSELGNLSIFGNVQQQNYQILYDNENNVLSFAPTLCDAF